jgi:hypothetical protein
MLDINKYFIPIPPQTFRACTVFQFTNWKNLGLDFQPFHRNLQRDCSIASLMELGVSSAKNWKIESDENTYLISINLLVVLSHFVPCWRNLILILSRMGFQATKDKK